MKPKLKTTNVFHKNYSSCKRIKINRWWTRSWKTYNLLGLFLSWLLTWNINKEHKIEKGILSICRKHKATLTKTCQRDFEEIIDELGVREELWINKSLKTYTFGQRTVEFIGADDQQKLRWGKRNILYCNEWNELDFETEFFQLSMRTTDYIFIDFNPDDEDIWINREIEEKRSMEKWDVDTFISTYKDNPFLPKAQIEEIEYLEHTNPSKWKVYWLWQYGRIEWLIFKKEENYEIIQEVPKEADLLWYWLDFWFSQDECAVVWVYKWNWWIVLNEIVYEKKLTNRKLAQIMKDKWVSAYDEIICDSSEPKSIEELCDEGLNALPVVKWPWSVYNWIKKMWEYKLYITANSSNLQAEIRKRVFKTDKNWKTLKDPVDKDNHILDASRYGMTGLLWGAMNDDSLFIW